MDTLTLTLVIAVALLGLAVVVLLVRRGFGGPTSPPAPQWHLPAEASGRTVVLDLVVDDPDRAAIKRLVNDVGERALAASPEVVDVEVRDRVGTLLGHVHRPDPLPAPVELGREHHGPRPHRPNPVGGTTPPPVDHQGSGVELLVPERSFAARFELPEAVHARLTDADRPAELIRAILEAAGQQAELDGEVVRTEDTAVVVAQVVDDPNETLNHAFHRWQATGLPRGVVVRIGWFNPEYVRYREFAAPMVRHVGTDAIQRMADAVELDADPLELAIGAPVIR